ncbi:hypothetical protein [Cytobacillus oceanisediminis]|uniref:hypothetical protein n=1 Tax=Cytobacillus oceanisediminis TaxID=665099 RepID=UPI003735EE25
MSEALQRIKKDCQHHEKQIRENLIKIESYKESIKTLEECNIKELQLIKEYQEIIKQIEG